MMLRQFLDWLENAPAGARADAIAALARSYLHADIDAETRAGMEAVMTLALDDPAPVVRFALADAIGNHPQAPRHLILSLASDQVEIACLVLSRSPIFIDAELVDIVAGGAELLQCAIAARPAVALGISAAIAEVGEANACRRLLANPGARIARLSLKRLAERLGDDADLRADLLARPDLPASIRQMLVLRLSDALGNLTVVKAFLPAERVQAVTRDACDRATVAIAAETEQEELPALVEHLRVTGQLTTALLLRAVCAGNVAFFETALAILARAPEERVASLVRAGRRAALRAIYAKAGLPALAFDAFTAALDTWRRFDAQGAPAEDRYRFTRAVVEAVLERYSAITDGEMNELAAMLRRFAADQAREAARLYVAAVTAA